MYTQHQATSFVHQTTGGKLVSYNQAQQIKQQIIFYKVIFNHLK